MTLFKLLQVISDKKLQLDNLRPLSKEQLKNLKQVYDIDLTYNSNAIEGSTLTYSETRLILNEGLAIGGKKMNEHLEVINIKFTILKKSHLFFKLAILKYLNIIYTIIKL